MEIVNIEARTFERMMERFEEFTRRVESLCDSKMDKRLDKWLDNQDVCIILDISKRTLQTYRDNGTLPFTRIENKIYYRPADVELVIKGLTERQKPKSK